MLECNQDVLEYLYPYDCLFKRTSDIRSFSSIQQILNLKYLIYNQFFHQDPDFNLGILMSYQNSCQMKKQEQLHI
ncbi:unnamed protein product [Paramecium pentaurelia]|uniref:Uncharacterized protein n=1 Tax=Paramecium pentaurelia TaxID=43138 RepID=A0A8S1SL67_9CILI|nr:unnamed protein product [Paramecium pentaurelia]